MICVWPTRLAVSVSKAGGSFELEVTAHDAESVLLPGDDSVWPQDIRVDGKPAVVVDVDGCAVGAPRGRSPPVSGVFLWSEVPDSLAVPPEIALVDLKRDGKAVAFPARQEGLLRLLDDDEVAEEDEPEEDAAEGDRGRGGRAARRGLAVDPRRRAAHGRDPRRPPRLGADARAEAALPAVGRRRAAARRQRSAAAIRRGPRAGPPGPIGQLHGHARGGAAASARDPRTARARGAVARRRGLGVEGRTRGRGGARSGRAQRRSGGRPQPDPRARRVGGRRDVPRQRRRRRSRSRSCSAARRRRRPTSSRSRARCGSTWTAAAGRWSTHPRSDAPRRPPRSARRDARQRGRQREAAGRHRSASTDVRGRGARRRSRPARDLARRRRRDRAARRRLVRAVRSGRAARRAAARLGRAAGERAGLDALDVARVVAAAGSAAAARRVRADRAHGLAVDRGRGAARRSASRTPAAATVTSSSCC
jgi:hypothetical protein